MNNKLFCQIRKKNVKDEPEERVRQAMLTDLLNNYNIPKGLIFAEKLLSKYGVDTKKRADIVIDYLDKYKVNHALVVIECKNENIPLTYKVHNQVLEYAELTNARVYGITNGEESDFYIRGENREFKQLAILPSYNDILNMNNLKYIENNPYLPFEEDDEDDYIGEKTHNALKPFIRNLVKCFFNENKKIERFICLKQKIEMLDDVGLRYEDNGNSSGGSWSGNYRNMIIKTNMRCISLGLTVLAGEDKSTKFIVSSDGHNSLQLTLDDWSLMKGDKVQIWHDGKITVGKLGSAKKEEMIEFVRNIYPNMVLRDHIFLGTLDNSQELTFENQDVKIFVENVVKYVICREKFRIMKKQNSEK